MAHQNETFNSIEEEKDYYKNLAFEYEKRLREAQLELEEFQESSRELEAELEAQLEQAEGRNKELRAVSSRLQMECETLQEKLEKIQHDSYRQINDLQDELAHLKATTEDLQKYVRELEQINDDLERAKRATLSSLEDFESRLNQAIERNAFLESELDEKEALTVMVQRLKDESRDLRQEMVIHQTSKPTATHALDNDLKVDRIQTIDSNKLKTEIESQTGSAIKSLSSSQLNTSCTPLTPSARISALNIVGDLLRKVGALESKLASCRTYVKDCSPKSEKEDGGSQVTSPVRVKRHNKGSPLASPQDCISLTA